MIHLSDFMFVNFLLVLFYLLCALSYSRSATSQCDWISVYYPLHVTHVTFDSRGRRLFCCLALIHTIRLSVEETKKLFPAWVTARYKMGNYAGV